MLYSIVAAFLSDLLMISHASIAGITYMDNFDFSQRYRDINECNPLYWHPLHLPDDCAEMFEKAIRSRITSNVPIRLVKDREAEISSPYDIPLAYGEISQAPIRTEISYYGHPFGKMLELLSRDVKDHPRAPTVGLLPNVGLVALYQQPISRKSEKIIKKIASIYAPPVAYNTQLYPEAPINIPNKTTNCTDRSEIIKLIVGKNNPAKVITKKIKKGNALAILKRKILK